MNIVIKVTETKLNKHLFLILKKFMKILKILLNAGFVKLHLKKVKWNHITEKYWKSRPKPWFTSYFSRKWFWNKCCNKRNKKIYDIYYSAAWRKKILALIASINFSINSSDNLVKTLEENDFCYLSQYFHAVLYLL